MISLAIVMRGEFVQGLPQVLFAARNDAVHALVFHGTDEPFGGGVAVRRTRRCPNHADARRGQPRLRPAAPLRIAITEPNASVVPERPVSPVICRRH